MGVLAPGSAHSRPSAQPPIGHVWEGRSKKLKIFPINFLAMSCDSKHFSFFPRKTLNNQLPLGQGGSPKFFSTPNLIFWVS